MSDFQQPGQVPPPPPGFGTPPPPPSAYPTPPGFPTAPAYGAPPAYSSAPPGYVAYGQAGGAVGQPSGLRTASIVLFWVASALSVVVGFLAYARGTVLADFFAGSKSLQDVDDADKAVNGVAGLVIFVQIAAVIVLCIWSHHTVRNAKQRDPSLNVSPGMAAGGWYIPIGSIWLPWQQLRRAARRFASISAAVTTWQLLYLVGSIAVAVGRGLGNTNADSDTADDAVTRFHAQGVVMLIGALIWIVATIVAMRAMREVDAATSGQTT